MLKVKHSEVSNSINTSILFSAFKLVYNYILVYKRVYSASKYDGRRITLISLASYDG